MSVENVEKALLALKRGEFVVVTDDATRENEADLILAAERATPEALAFMVRHTSGLVCVGMSKERLRDLNLPLMVADNSESHETAFTVSVDYRHATSTGISAQDRSATIRALADARCVASDFARPGHVFPLRAKDGGVLRRAGHTEAALDLARLSGHAPAGVLCELVQDDGSMLRPANLAGFAERFGLPVLSIAELCAYRRIKESLVEHVAEARLPTRHGLFTAHVYRSRIDGQEHVALVKGDVCGARNVLVRVHSECFTGDVFSSVRCDCRAQLEAALAKVAAAGQGVVVYLRGHEGRGIGLASKLHAYALQDRGRDTVEANLDLGLPVDSRTYDVGAQILTDLGVTTLRLMSNNPAKFTQLVGYRLEIVERVPLITEPTAENATYLRTKQQKLGHQLGLS
ncbi:MAG TPA: bifunctional 3,4-dihydroxy-2-butanone-4-phosphate synthase/GTP cyclohydrolase II, partial [Polyangiaceae bacterium]|nr:bifunctional 3,4-dihydroxy-2-butanone-4-phosphate synthase/GTP cyclohydrolase II [Polyangiaceae bacterium]